MYNVQKYKIEFKQSICLIFFYFSFTKVFSQNTCQLNDAKKKKLNTSRSNIKFLKEFFFFSSCYCYPKYGVDFYCTKKIAVIN